MKIVCFDSPVADYELAHPFVANGNNVTGNPVGCLTTKLQHTGEVAVRCLYMANANLMFGLKIEGRPPVINFLLSAAWEIHGTD